MDDALPTFAEVLDLIRSAKPPIACRMVELRDHVAHRSARVLFDGIQGWFIEDDAGVELRTADGSVLFDAAGELERVGPTSTHVHSNAWVKTAIEGRLMDLDRATGQVVRTEEFGGRRAVIVEVAGLRAGDDVTFRIHVDLVTGIVLQMSRPDLDVVLRIEELRVGSIAQD